MNITPVNTIFRHFKSTPGSYILNKPPFRVAEPIETLLCSRTQRPAGDGCAEDRHGENFDMMEIQEDHSIFLFNMRSGGLTCVRASEMWHCGILRLKLRHSVGTSGKAHTPSVHAAPDPACSDEAEHNTDVKR